jgi:hypothetical protein
VLQNLAWVLNGITNYSLFKKEDIAIIIYSAKVLLRTSVLEVQIDSLCVLQTFSETSSDIILGWIANTEKLIDCLALSINEPDILTPCLKTVCNLTNSSDSKIFKTII